MASIKDTLKATTEDLLSEEALNEIENVFNEAVEAKAQLQVEAALTKQDDEHATKVQTLLEAIDDDHSKKLENIVEAINTNHAEKLKTVIAKYQAVINEDAKTFKGSLIDTISNYLDVYLENTFPADMIEEAVKNKRSESVLQEVRKLLGVDLALAKDTIREAVADGKKTIVTQHEELDKLVKENAELKTKLTVAESESTLEELSKDLPEHKRNYVNKVLAGKDPEFIKENFEYTVNLFDKEYDQEVEQLKEEATSDAEGTKVDTIVENTEVANEAPVVQENDDDPLFNGYMGELGKY